MSHRELVLVAGPNGSGKSTVTEEYIRDRFPAWPKLNADNVAAALARLEAPPAADEAFLKHVAGMTDHAATVLALLETPFVLETVLSSDKYRGLVTTARRLGLVFRLVYVTTRTPVLNIARVRQRVAAGGHDVPEDRIRARWTRSMDNLPWFAARADRVLVVDNSGDRPAVLALRRHQGPLELVVPNHPASDRLLPLQGARVLAPDARAAP